MKIIKLATLLLFISPAISQDLSEEGTRALQGSYQDMRNVAFSLSQNNDRQAKVGACAIRRAIIIAKQDKVDDSDYTNQYVDCSQIKASENLQSWDYTMGIINQILQFKKNKTKIDKNPI